MTVYAIFLNVRVQDITTQKLMHVASSVTTAGEWTAAHPLNRKAMSDLGLQMKYDVEEWEVDKDY